MAICATLDDAETIASTIVLFFIGSYLVFVVTVFKLRWWCISGSSWTVQAGVFWLPAAGLTGTDGISTRRLARRPEPYS